MNAPANLESAFLQLVDANRQRILKVCRVYARGQQDGEDLYQEILFQIWRGLPNLKQNAFAHTWVYRVALNSAISFVRRNKAQRRPETTDHDHLIEHADRRNPPRDALGDSRVEALYEAIANLNVYERAVIALYLEDMSYEQIAQVMGISANHVGVMLHRSKARLSAMMNEVTA